MTNSEQPEEAGEDEFGYAFVRDQESKIYFHNKKKGPGNVGKAFEFLCNSYRKKLIVL